jgi:hypothetical protein
MALSGSYDWTLTRDQVITGALRKLGVLPNGTSPSTAQTNDAADALNALVKAFQADGMPLWAITSHTWTVTAGTASYTIGVGQTLNTVAPLKVFQAFYTIADSNQTPMNVYNRYDFNQLPVNGTTIEGTPVNLYYQPTSGSSGEPTGTIKLWPVPVDSTTQVTIHYQRPYNDMDSASNNFDFPSYWIQALIYNLAWSLSPEYGVPPTDRTLLAEEAKYWKDYALGFGSEEGSVFIQPYTRM